MLGRVSAQLFDTFACAHGMSQPACSEFFRSIVGHVTVPFVTVSDAVWLVILQAEYRAMIEPDSGVGLSQPVKYSAMFQRDRGACCSPIVALCFSTIVWKRLTR